LKNSTEIKKESSVTDTSTELTEKDSTLILTHMYVYIQLIYCKGKVVPEQGRYIVRDRAPFTEFSH
jgi:hypothetical protein